MLRHTLSRAVCVAFLAWGIAVVPAVAGEIELMWDHSNGATGYKAHWGTSSGQYPNSKDAGSTTQTTIANLQDCTTHFAVATAYNSAGESGFSNEVSSWPRPVVRQTNPSSGERGERLNVIITGTNYQNGATVTFANPGITVNSITRNACGQATADISIGSSAPLGSTDVLVINPNGVRGVGAGLFAVRTPQVQVPSPPGNLRIVTP